MEERKEAEVYDIIKKKAGSNIMMQGLTGWFGFPFTLFADVAALFTHYGPMLNEIRAVYGRTPMTSEYLGPIIKGCKDEVISDIIVDKVVGNVPFFGLPANMIAAKAMTWRLGILFGMLAAQGEDISLRTVENSVALIRNAFPKKESYLFRKPSEKEVEKLLLSVEDNPIEDNDSGILEMMEA